MFASVLTIKKELHKFYDIVRAKEPTTILSPLFDKPKTNEGRVKEELRRTNKALDSVKNAERMNQRLSFINLDGSGGGGGGSGENKRLREEIEEVKKENTRLKAFIREKMVDEARMIDEAREILGEG
ncbi:hypothetical protein TrVE_jg12141 [Triparma verrucosa]|nr:hypothetical protein TrVE_jg12141 [Triparma verrucosa]